MTYLIIVEVIIIIKPHRSTAYVDAVCLSHLWAMPKRLYGLRCR